MGCSALNAIAMAEMRKWVLNVAGQMLEDDRAKVKWHGMGTVAVLLKEMGLLRRGHLVLWRRQRPNPNPNPDPTPNPNPEPHPEPNPEPRP